MHPEPDAVPDALAPLAFLLGTWRGEGVGGYPTIGDFRYAEEIRFSHSGRPFLAYEQRSWVLPDERPSATEVGYWRPQPDGSVEVLICRPSGISEIYLGTVRGTQVEIATDVVTRTPSAKDVSALKRLYGLVDGELMYAVDMAAMGQPLQPHLSARLRRVAG
ncbi:MAG: FABP family protein [Mycobacteriales bacterium]|nr:FABP family protein [Frankia sp.]